MATDRKKYIMSVELAMKREMAYREKLEKLRQEPGTYASKITNCSSKDQLPPKVPKPTPKKSAPGTAPTATPSSCPAPTPSLPPKPRSTSIRITAQTAPSPTVTSSSQQTLGLRSNLKPRPNSTTAPMATQSPALSSRPEPTLAGSRPVSTFTASPIRTSPASTSRLKPTQSPLPSPRPTATSFTAAAATPSPALNTRLSSPLPGSRPVPTATTSPGLQPSQRPATTAFQHTARANPVARPYAFPRPGLNPYILPSLRQTPLPRTNYLGTTPGLNSSPSTSGPSTDPQNRIEPLHQVNSKYYCNLCQADCNSPTNFRTHVKGHKHRSRVRASKAKPGTHSNNQQRYCELCRIWCSDEYGFRQHLVGKNHILKLHTSETMMGGL